MLEKSPLAFPFKWVQESKWHSEAGQVFVLEMNPCNVVPAISVQFDWNESQGIIRGVKDSTGNLVEDHIREELRDGKLIDAGRRIVGADDIRKDVWTVGRHKEEFAKLHPDENVVGYVGNGNLLSNPHFVGYSENRLVHLAAEAQHLASRHYSSLVVKTAGSPNRVAIDRIDYERTSAGLRIRSGDGRDITGEVEYATFGQHIVRGGNPVDAAQLTEMVVAGQLYDLRHVFLLGRIPVGEKRWLDAGLSAFWDDHAFLNVQAITEAMNGQPVRVDVGPSDHGTIREAMSAKGYTEVPSPQSTGQYSLRNDEMQVVLLEGLYPHNMIGIREDGWVISVVLRGLSNRLGVTIRGAAELMRSLGAKDALLIDNGGDVTMSFNGDLVLGSAEGERNRLRSLLLFRSASKAAGIQPTDFRLVQYPKQYLKTV